MDPVLCPITTHPIGDGKHFRHINGKATVPNTGGQQTTPTYETCWVHSAQTWWQMEFNHVVRNGQSYMKDVTNCYWVNGYPEHKVEKCNNWVR